MGVLCHVSQLPLPSRRTKLTSSAFRPDTTTDMITTLSSSSMRTMTDGFASLCEAAGTVAQVTSVAGTEGKPDFWPEGQSDKVLNDMKRWWPGSLILFADGAFGYTPTEGEVARRQSWF